MLNEIPEALALSLELTIDEDDLLRAREQFIIDAQTEKIVVV